MYGNTSSPFGQKPATPGVSGFGALSASTIGSPGTTAFGTPQQSAFGQTTTASSFGQTTTAATFGQTPSTPAFGQANATPAFGQASSTPSFGQTGSTSAFGQATAAPTFGQGTAAPAFGQATAAPTFGQATAAPTFGQSANTTVFGQPNVGFGASSTQPSFGTSTTTPAFGSTAPTFGTTNFGSNQQKIGFGIPAVTTQSTLSIGAAAQTAPTTTQATGFQLGGGLGQSGFGTTTTTSVSTLGAATTQASLTFSSPQTSTPSLTFGAAKPGAISFGTTTSTTQSGLTFGTSLTSKPSTTQGSMGFSFGSSGTTAVTQTPTTSTTQALSQGLSSFTASGLSSLGSAIGGKSMLTITGNTATPLYSTKTADLQAGRNSGQVPPKCQIVQPMIMELVESFKCHMKDQKHLCMEASRASLKPISKISLDAENIKRSVLKLERAVNKNKLLNSKLKEETVKALTDVEVAQKAMDIPGGFPSDNSIITDYFLQLTNRFQQQVVALRVELESTEKSVLCELNPAPFTPQELSTTMQRLYECFVALAGRFQFVHAQISNLKVHHLELRKKKLGDYSDIFNKKNLTVVSRPTIKDTLTEGPSSFIGARTSSFVMPSLGYPVNDSLVAQNINYSNTLGNSIFGQTMNTSLQNSNLLSPTLQQSAPGSKRGKR